MPKVEDIQKKLERVKDELAKAEKSRADATARVATKKKELKQLEAELVIAMMTAKNMDITELEQLLDSQTSSQEN